MDRATVLTQTTTADGIELSHAERNRTLLLLSGGHGVAHWYNGILSVLYPALTVSLGLSFSQVGLFDSSRGALAVLVSLAGGYLADVFGHRRLMLAFALASLGVCTFFLSFSTTFIVALLWLTIGGIGNSLWHPYALPVLNTLFAKRRGLAIALHDAGANSFHGIAPVAVGAMLSVWHWETVTRLHLWPGVIMGLFLLLLIPKVELGTTKKQTRHGYRSALGSGLFRNRQFLVASGVSGGLTMGRLGLFTFLPLFLAFELHLDSTFQGLYMGILTLSGALLSPLTGVLADRFGFRTVLMVAMLLGSIVIAALSVTRHGILLAAMIAFLGIALFSTRSLIMVYAMNVVPEELGGSSVGAVFSINRMFGILAPLLAGFMADIYGLRIVFYFLGGLVFVGMLLTFALRSEV